MTEHQATEPFEARLTDLVRAYADVATARPIDALEVSRTAMSSPRPSGWPTGRLDALFGRRGVDARWAVAGLAVVLIGVVGFGVIGRPAISSAPSPTVSAGGPVPAVLRHSWQRPLPVAPGPDVSGGSGVLSLADGQLQSRSDPGAAPSRSSISATGADGLTVTATVETLGCAVGDVGAYRWLLEGKGTVMTLTAMGTDACAAREAAVIGPWVRSDLPPPVDPAATLSPGTHLTSGFDPFDDPAASIRLSYTVGEGWKVKEDLRTTFTMDQPTTGSIMVLMAHPRMVAPRDVGVPCGVVGDAPDVGGSLDDLVAAIQARPGVISTQPAPVTIAGHEGRSLDLRIAASGTGGCRAPDGSVAGVAVLHQAGSAEGPVIGVAPDRPLRLILVDLGQGQTMAVALFEIETTQPAEFAARVAEAMPIVESFEFRSAAP